MRTFYSTLLGVMLVAVVAAALVLWVRHDSRPGVEVLLPTPSTAPQVKVYVSGAVVEPGVYDVRNGERVADAIAAAGGPTDEADLEAVNLALRLRDEDHLHVPKVGETMSPAVGLTGKGQEGAIDINTASIEELKSLPGIGEVKARAIMEYREEKGGFQSPEEVLEVSGVGPATFGAIRDRITVR